LGTSAVFNFRCLCSCAGCFLSTSCCLVTSSQSRLAQQVLYGTELLTNRVVQVSEPFAARNFDNLTWRLCLNVKLSGLLSAWCKTISYLIQRCANLLRIREFFFARLWKFNPMHANSFNFRDSSHFLFFSIFNILRKYWK
jgi:hypothetical protein